MPASETPTATPAIGHLDGWSLEPFAVDDAALLAELMQERGHRYVLEIPADESSIAVLLGEVAKQPWSMSAALVQGDDLGGFAATALPNVRALSVSVTALFVDPSNATLPLAMYLRHLFWSFPLHRVHTQIPELDLTREYVDLLTSAGFALEGRLVDHARIAGQTFDVVALGLLRPDFEAWCDQNEPRLSLR